MLRRSSKALPRFSFNNFFRSFATSETSNAQESGNFGNTPFEASSDRTLHLSNLPLSSTRDKLSEVLNSSGMSGVKRIHVPINRYSQTARGYAFVEFDSAEAAEKARSAQVSFEGQPLTFSAARTPEQAQQYKIYVGDLSYNTSEADLRQALEKFGPVDFVSIAQENGRSKGFAFVNFKTVEGAEAARNARNFTLDDKVVRVERVIPRVPRSRTGESGSRGGFDRDSGFGGGRRQGGRGDFGGDRDFGGDSESSGLGGGRRGGSRREGGGYGAARSDRGDFGGDRNSGFGGGRRREGRDSSYGDRSSGFDKEGSGSGF